MLLPPSVAQEVFAPNNLSYLELYQQVRISISSTMGADALTVLVPKTSPCFATANGQPLRVEFGSFSEAEAYFCPETAAAKPPASSGPPAQNLTS